MNTFILLVFGVFFASEASADELNCEKINTYTWNTLSWRTCWMQKTTVIRTPDLTISSRHDTVEGLIFSYNKKVKYLPIKLQEKFPNLVMLAATHCSIKMISKENFSGLYKMKLLNLQTNQLEKIDAQTFTDMTFLEKLWLHNNKLKIISSEAFTGLTKLIYLDFSLNQCISEKFEGASILDQALKAMNEKCSIDQQPVNGEVESTTLATVTLADNKNCEEFMIRLNQIENSQSQECGKIVEKALETQARDCSNRENLLNAKLEDKIVKFSQSEALVMVKMNEIETLRDELQKKHVEIVEKNEKIRKLQEKVETLSQQIFK